MTATEPRPAPSESLRDAQKRLTRQRLIDAARQTFADKGFADTTVDDIVDRAGASRGTYYLYYKGKSDILADLFESDYLQAVFELFSDFPAAPVTERSLRDWFSTFIGLYRDRRWTMRLWMLADSLQPELRNETTRMLDEILERLGRAIAERRGTKGAAALRDAKVAAFLMFSQLEQYGYFRVLREYPLNDDAALKTLARMWLPMVNPHA